MTKPQWDLGEHGEIADRLSACTCDEPVGRVDGGLIYRPKPGCPQHHPQTDGGTPAAGADRAPDLDVPPSGDGAEVPGGPAPRAASAAPAPSPPTSELELLRDLWRFVWNELAVTDDAEHAAISWSDSARLHNLASAIDDFYGKAGCPPKGNGARRDGQLLGAISIAAAARVVRETP